jgi:hypothetical protein
MVKVLDKRWDEHNKMEAYSETDASPTQIPGPVRFKLKPRTHTDSDFDALYMNGKITTRPFQFHLSQLQFRLESLEVNETIQSPEVALVLRHRRPVGPCTELSPLGMHH